MKSYALVAVPIVPLCQHDFLGDKSPLIHCTEPNDISSARICFLVPMSNAHSTSDSHIEANQFTVFDDRNEPNVVGVHVNIVGRRDGDGNFELTSIS